MREFIMSACDLHDGSMILKVAVGTAAAEKWVYDNNAPSRRKMIARLKALSKAHRGMPILFAYESCGLGYYLRDELEGAGIRCLVLPSTSLPKSPKNKLNKNDEKDADRILAVLRSIQGGQEVSEVWVPPAEMRADRDLVRTRVSAAEKLASIRTQIRSLFKRLGRKCHGTTSRQDREWLQKQLERLPSGTDEALESLLRQMDFYEREVAHLDERIHDLAESPRYRKLVEAVRQEEKGVGELVAMVFLTELGDCLRFHNRRKVGGYLGLAPRSDETGKADDRKGHITHQGPAVVRKMLCQAVWCQNRCAPRAKARYEKLVARNPQHKKIAVVAMMRQLAVRMWHRAVAVTESGIEVEAGRAASGPLLAARAERSAIGP